MTARKKRRAETWRAPPRRLRVADEQLLAALARELRLQPAEVLHQLIQRGWAPSRPEPAEGGGP